MGADLLDSSMGGKAEECKPSSKSSMSCQDSTLYSPIEGQILDITLMKNFEAREQLMTLPSVPRYMTTLAWNVRGLARPSFRTNFLHLISVHNLDVVVLTKLGISARNCEKILKKLSFDNRMIVDAEGFAGGIAILWNSANINFTMLSKGNHMIYGVVQAVDSFHEEYSNSDFLINIIMDYRELKQQFSRIQLQFEKRSMNQLADCLAKIDDVNSFMNTNVTMYFDEPPDCCMGLYVNDLMNLSDAT